MARYYFQATDVAGKIVEGEIDAADESDARAQLQQRGLVVHQVAWMAAVTPNLPANLTAGESEEVLGHVANVSLSNASLVVGLQAAASEASNRRVAAALHYLATEVARGRGVQDVLSDTSTRMPRHVRGL